MKSLCRYPKGDSALSPDRTFMVHRCKKGNIFCVGYEREDRVHVRNEGLQRKCCSFDIRIEECAAVSAGVIKISSLFQRLRATQAVTYPSPQVSTAGV